MIRLLYGLRIAAQLRFGLEDNGVRVPEFVLEYVLYMPLPDNRKMQSISSNSSILNMESSVDKISRKFIVFKFSCKIDSHIPSRSAVQYYMPCRFKTPLINRANIIIHSFSEKNFGHGGQDVPTRSQGKYFNSISHIQFPCGDPRNIVVIDPRRAACIPSLDSWCK